MRRSATNAKTAAKIIAAIIATILAAIGALACLVPALEMNIAAHSARGGPWFEAAPYIAGVFVAAAAGAILPIAKRHKAIEVIFACLVLGVAAVSFNLKNAMTASTLSRAEFSDPRQAQIERIARLEAREKILANSSHGSSQRSSQELRAILAAKEADPIFTRADRSDRCRNPTIADSARFCAERAAILADIARAEAAEREAAELAEIRRELASIGTRPAVADPVVDNLAGAVALFVSVDPTDRAWIGWANDLHSALFVELAAAFGPMLFVFLIGLLWRQGREAAVIGPRSRQAAVVKPIGEPATAAMPVDAPACVRAFFTSQIVPAPGGKIGASDLYAAYAASCGREPVTQNRFGRIAGAVYTKDRGRYPAYIGIALRGPRLAAVSG
jgi:hypothetical protein